MVTGYDSVWFFGDDFGCQTFYEYYFDWQDNFKGYAKEHFEVIGFINDLRDNEDRSIISQFHNTLVHALEEKPLLPKIIVIVPDDDIINFLNFAEYGVSKCLGRVIDWIMREHIRIIDIYKEFLPARAKRSTYPQILWIDVPTHDGFKNNLMRQKYNYAVNTAAQFHENTWTLQLKKVWDPHNHSLYNKEEDKYSVEGIKMYWEAVDKTVRYTDTILLKKPTKPKVTAVPPSEKPTSVSISSSSYGRLPSYGHSAEKTRND